MEIIKTEFKITSLSSESFTVSHSQRTLESVIGIGCSGSGDMDDALCPRINKIALVRNFLQQMLSGSHDYLPSQEEDPPC